MADGGGASPGARPGPDSSALLAAALGYAARGWPVFPCNPKNKQPLLGADKGADNKPIRGTGGLKKASTDPEQIAAWWKRWPGACIGLCPGHPTKGTETAEQPAGLTLLCLDFDPRTDPDTGEVFDLRRLKSETEAQLGCTLPESLAVLTPSDGVHLYLLVGDTGPPIGNRGNLPDHVDVRGLGGYVIAPPSVLSDGRRYRLHRKEPIGGIAKAPERLLEVLRERKGAPAEASTDPAKVNQRPKSQLAAAVSTDDAVRKYALAALDAECRELAATPIGGGRWGGRNQGIFYSALALGSLAGAGALSESVVRAALTDVIRGMPHNEDMAGALATLENGLTRGISSPRDLSEIEAAARERGQRGPRSSASPARPAPADRPYEQPFRNGNVAGVQPRRGPGAVSSAAAPTAADLCRLKRIAEAWLDKRLNAEELTPDKLKAIAWGCGRRIAAGDLDDGATREKLWKESEEVAGLTLDDLDRAIEQGIARGFDPGPTLLDLECGRYPLTDFGLAERFRDRFGDEFRFTTAKGWLGWDGRRWKLLDQDKDTPPAELIAAMFETIRLVQREAKRIRDTGVRHQLRKEGKREFVDEQGEPLDAALDYFVPKGRSFVLFSSLLAAFGRSSEQSGKPSAIAALARRWLMVQLEQFDCEQMAVNCLNGTLRFAVERLPDGRKKVAVRLDPHDRGDLITKVAAVDYDRDAAAPLYDGMIAWAQPDPAVRRYVHQVGGYSITGHTGEHKLWFHYGRGRNGKSTAIDSWCSALGDYSGTIQIESFLDQGIKKRGDAATPDLAKLGGVRLLRASEPERGAKLNSALIKAATGGEPMSVRALHKGFFDLVPRFKPHFSGNSKPGIPDTDEGIWGRMRLVPWKRHIEKPDEDPYRDTFPCPEWPKKDTELLDKIKGEIGGVGELAGVFTRLVEGLVDYLQYGFAEPEGVTLATADYRDKSDPLGRFLRLCTERAAGSRVKSSELHAVFSAWCKAAGEKEWTPPGFASAMEDKGYTKMRSDGMRWEDIALTRQASDFVDAEGKVIANLPDLEAEAEAARAPPGPDPPLPKKDDEIIW